MVYMVAHMEQPQAELLSADTCRAVAEAVLGWQVWSHRRVESLRLLEGRRGRRRISLDCTPPPEPALAYEAAERSNSQIEDVRGPLMIPLAIFAKQAMRDLDVVDTSGEAVPILGLQENGILAWSALVHAVGHELEGTMDASIIEMLHDIAFSP